SDLLAWDPLFG
nr:Chain CCC, F-BAR domain only protein 2 [Homo sapiens]7OIQ_DDD Chain DDD, F-BAR domain only protein 2 [Homo sapiens]7OIT_BBB Chain BBB, F-BAR domain only protein 2 [Homo sapiens]